MKTTAFLLSSLLLLASDLGMAHPTDLALSSDRLEERNRNFGFDRRPRQFGQFGGGFRGGRGGFRPPNGNGGGAPPPPPPNGNPPPPPPAASSEVPPPASSGTPPQDGNGTDNGNTGNGQNGGQNGGDNGQGGNGQAGNGQGNNGQGGNGQGDNGQGGNGQGGNGQDGNGQNGNGQGGNGQGGDGQGDNGQGDNGQGGNGQGGNGQGGNGQGGNGQGGNGQGGNGQGGNGNNGDDANNQGNQGDNSGGEGNGNNVDAAKPVAANENGQPGPAVPQIVNNGGQTLSPNVLLDTETNGNATAGQAQSAVTDNNYIDFCVGKTLTNGKQVKEGSCAVTPIGDIPSTNNMVSTMFTSPENFGTVNAGQTFTIALAVRGMILGSFTDAQKNYYAGPQQLGNNGQIVGHAHVTVQPIDSIQSPGIPDPEEFVFFKGFNNGGENGVLTIDVEGGLDAGAYRMCTIMSNSNHASVILPVAQRGAENTCSYFTVQ